MTRYSHQYLIAVAVESEEPDPDKVPVAERIAAVARRLSDIVLYDKAEAFAWNDTAEV